MYLRAGDTYDWTETHPDYSADAGWVVKWRLAGTAGTAKEVNAVSTGTQHAFDLESSDTTVTPGQYAQIIVAINAAESKQKTLSVESIAVLANPTGGTMPQGYWRTTYEFLQTTYQGLAKKLVAQTNIHGRQTVLAEIDKIRGEMTNAKREMTREEQETAAGTKTKSGRLIAQFLPD